MHNDELTVLRKTNINFKAPDALFKAILKSSNRIVVELTLTAAMCLNERSVARLKRRVGGITLRILFAASYSIDPCMIARRFG